MNLAVTGISSYLARTLFPLLESEPSIEKILGLDLKEPTFSSPKLKFVRADVRDPDFDKHLGGCDALVHLAYIVMPIRDMAMADDININGSKNVFEAAAKAGIKKIVHLSSIAAYGAWPDNPEIITEDVPVRGMPSFYYSRSKAKVENLLDEFEKQNPDMVMTRLRPCIFIGPTIENVIKNIAGAKVMVGFRGHERRVQFVWDEDVAQAVVLALKGDHHGAFNLAGDGYLTPSGMAEIMGVGHKNLPYTLVYWMSRVFWFLGKAPLDSGWVEVMRYPIIVSSEKAKKELGWKPSFDTAGAFRELIRTIPSQS